MEKMKVGIISAGILPIPAVDGGAVESLIENILNKNEFDNKMEFVVFSTANDRAKDKAEKYKNTNFVFIGSNCFIKLADKITYFIAKRILRRKNLIAYRHIFQRYFFLRKVGKKINKMELDKLVLENHFTEYIAIKYKDNQEKFADKIYYHAHNSPTYTNLYYEYIKNSKKIISVSNYVQKVAKKLLPDMEEKKFCVLKNCVDQEKFKPKYDGNQIKQIKQKYNIPLDKKIILFSGRITPEKGIMHLIEAMKQIHENCHLVIVGDYYYNSKTKIPFATELNQKLQDIKGRYSFTGFVNYCEMNEVYAIADLVVLPSICEDSAPLTVIETITSGKPLITTDSGGIPEYATNGCAIILKRDEELVNNISKYINDIINDDNKILEMSKNAIIAAEGLNVENYCKNFYDILNNE